MRIGWLIAILVWASVGCADPSPRANQFRAENGTIDLSGWDFEKDGSVALEGDWLFSWGEVVAPGTWSEISEKMPHMVPVRGFWDAFEHIQGIQPRGHATYALRILGLERADVRLDFSGLYRSAKTQSIAEGVVIDEVLVGKVGRSKAEEIPVAWVDPQLKLSLREDSGLLIPGVTVLVHLANYHHPLGGISSAPTLRLSTASIMMEQKREFLAHLLLGFLLIAGLYHLVLFLLRRDDQVALYFGLFCLVLALRVVSMGVGQSFGLTETVAQYDMLMRIEYLAMPLMMATLGLFLGELIPRQSFRLFVYIWTVGGGGLLSLLALFAQPYVFAEYLYLFQMEILVGLIATIFHLGYAVSEKTPFAGWCLGAFLLAASGGVNDILHTNGVIETAHIVPFTLMGFVLLQSAIIAKKFASAFEERDASNQALLASYQQLDAELLKRETLQEANAALERDNEAASQQLIQADKLATLGTLVAGVAHDIANPTGLIKLSREEVLKGHEQSKALIYELLGEPEDEETRAIVQQFESFFSQQKSGLADIELGVTRIAAINGAIRNQSRSDASVSQVAVRELIDECLIVVGSRLKEVEVTIRCDDALQIEVIRSQFGQVLMNLLANAADAVSEGSESKGRIWVSASRNDEATVKISIEDSGPGIPIELREKILQPFFTTKAVGKGTGLGMPIVVRILQDHGFDLLIEESEELGGAQFCLVKVGA